MHELSLCEGIIRIIERHVEKGGFTSVESVTLKVGDVSGVSVDALTFCFPLVSKGTIAEGASLLFVETSGREVCVESLDVRPRHDV